MFGAFINYFGARFVGRSFLMSYGKYFFISQQSIQKMDDFFEKHGAISTFTGRLIPGIRQLISIPAGLSKMNLKVFSFYTALGAGIWSIVLIALGYFIGDNELLIKTYLHQITLAVLGTIVIIISFYIYRKKHTKGQK
jgi:membrane protein DedA with SNARE-associated domain